jgi:hypothetical protein
MGSDSRRYVLRQDKQGMTWDLLLYVPTVVILLSIGLKLWFGSNRNWTYLLLFMASFFFIQGAMRILKSRLMLLPTAPTAVEFSKQRIRLELRSGRQVELVSELRYFPDFAGKSIALSGNDLNGRKQQYILHRGQFASEGEFKDLRAVLEVYR